MQRLLAAQILLAAGLWYSAVREHEAIVGDAHAPKTATPMAHKGFCWASPGWHSFLES